MMRLRCENCREIFQPDCRNIGRQKYCRKPECRKAAKAESQRRWLEKPENRDYFRGSAHVERVRIWRQNHPGYWRKKKPEPVKALTVSHPDSTGPVLSGKSAHATALQDSFPKNYESKQVDSKGIPFALQETLSFQQALLIGIISQFTGSALQDDIEKTIDRLQQLGHDILNDSHPKKGGNNDGKATSLPRTSAPGSRTVQLGGSPAGP